MQTDFNAYEHFFWFKFFIFKFNFFIVGEPCIVQTDCPDENLVCNAANFVCEEKTKKFKNAGVQTSIELINGIRKILKKSVTINEDVVQECKYLGYLYLNFK